MRRPELTQPAAARRRAAPPATRSTSVAAFFLLLFALLHPAAALPNCVNNGEYFEAGVCSPCPPNSFCPNDDTRSLCPAGTEQPNGGQESCVACGAGQYSSSDGTSCVDCPLGSSCTATAATPCPTGEESPLGVSTCSPCLAGTYLDGTTDSCVACANGFYQTASSEESCIECPAGHECPDKDQAPDPCPAGEHAAAGSISCDVCDNGFYQDSTAQETCIECPAGHECPDKDQAPVPCNAGEYAVAGSISCDACDNGFYQDTTAQETCDVCPEGFECTNKAIAPVQCSAGTASAEGEMTCNTCADGFYQDADGQNKCIGCPAGSECLDKSAAPVECLVGTFAPAQSTTCEPCADGSYAATNGRSFCLLCVAGLDCTDKTVAPVPCPAGFACLVPGEAPEACGAGSYSLGGTGSCNLCPAGQYCPVTDAAPISCPSGMYSLGGTTSCQSCPTGHYCEDQVTGPVACGAGLYSPVNATDCEQCPAGFACDPEPVACVAGTYSLAGYDDCTVCLPGTACVDPTQPPVDCNAGQYSINGTSCLNCPVGMACPYRNQGPLSNCPNGTYSLGVQESCTVCPAGEACPRDDAAGTPCLAGYFSTGGAAECTRCPAGWECPDLDGSANRQCVAGEFADAGATACTPCPAGQACPDPTSSSANSLCPAGTYSIEGDDVCNGCPPGSQCPSTILDTVTPCLAGSYAPANSANCTMCPAGFYCPDATSTTALPCPTGWYSELGEAACNECPAGSYCPQPDETPLACAAGQYTLGGATSCAGCPAGSRCPSTSTLPIECVVGTYSPGNMTACLDCTPGWICGTGSTVPEPPAGACTQGYYCPDSTAEVPCPQGTFGNGTSANGPEDCTLCPAGWFCDQVGMASGQQFICPQGAYCPVGTITPIQCTQETNCGDPTYGCGTFSSAVGATNASTCEPCPPGSVCFTGATDAGTLCPAGTFCVGSNFLAEPCPEGSYNPFLGQDGAEDCIDCPPGSYCDRSASFPTPCPAGTYNPDPNLSLQSQCRPCQAGFACPQTNMTNSFIYPCDFGHFCPNGTVAQNQRPCPPGTYGPSQDLTAASECTICPVGHYCPWGTGGPGNDPVECPPGYYCPAGTSYGSQFPCLPGSWSNLTMLDEPGDCYDCPDGNYCSGIGETFPSGDCAPGYYCPGNSSIATQEPCEAGTWSDVIGLARQEQCYDCPPGSYCPQDPNPSTTPLSCPAGFYTPVNNTAIVDDSAGSQVGCLECPAGSYCPEGSPEPLDCTQGWVSDAQAALCDPCHAGHYCPSNTTALADMLSLYQCLPGLYCPPGDALLGGEPDEPDFLDNACPTGQYCPQATPVPVNCPIGTFNPVTGLGAEDECTICTPGSYCLEGVDAVSGPCAAGHFCPNGTSGPTEFPCPATTYRSQVGAQSMDDCVACPYGRYCGVGDVGDNLCPRGYYCVVGVAWPEPCPIGTFGNSTGLRQVEECTDCPPGNYCDGSGLPNPRGPCDPGYYCSGRAYTSAPQGAPTGGLCPPGGYCPVGSSVPTACDAGTYNNFTGGRTQLDCQACTPGFYCAGSNNPFPTGPCFAGYFCNGSATAPTQYESEPGTYTDEGSSAPIPCPIGTYNTEFRKDECEPCPPGSYCPDQGMDTSVACPEGHYCEGNNAVPEPCPSGTYNDLTNRKNITACGLCDPGSYCSPNGQTEPTGLCYAGHYCPEGASSPKPTDLGTMGGDLCTPGHYCGNGTATPTKCPIGTYSAATGNDEVSDCIACTAGFYCNIEGIQDPTAYPCPAGFFCNAGCTTSSPVGGTPGGSFGGPVGDGGVCPVGHSCPLGTSLPVPCSAGTYSGTVQKSTCDACPAGYYCDSTTSVPVDCPQGSYCPEGTRTSTIRPCAAGSYGAGPNLKSQDECTQCEGGRYCSGTGKLASTGDCDPGYFCIKGNIQPDGDNNPYNDTFGGDCPVGSYCEVATSNPELCPPGTFLDTTRGEELADCNQCTPGSYCASHGLDAPTGLCAEGHFCPSGSTSQSEEDCTVGHYCPAGSPAELNCPAGTFQSSPLMGDCDDCPAGSYCREEASTTTQCPQGYYCPENTEDEFDFPCPDGTFGAAPALKALQNCTVCPGGSYCPSDGQSSTAGQCLGGYYCPGGDTVSAPPLTICPAGSFCPVGSTAPQTCPEGEYCLQGSATPTGDCDEGHYCPAGSSSDTEIECPVGTFCPTASDAPTDCVAGTYNPTPGAVSVAACLPCPAGEYCATDRLEFPTGDCAAGYYCDGGSTTDEEFGCTAGHQCPVGSGGETTCVPGTYQPDPLQAICLDCPAGSYCSDPDSADPCPAGYYCPPKTEFANQFPCPAGTFSNALNLEDVSECTPCLAGQYCENDGQTGVTGDCDGGYVCLGNSTTPTPTDNVVGYICPAGAYCEPGSSIEIECDAGSFNINLGQDEESDCLPCLSGLNCPNPRRTSTPTTPADDCAAGFFCRNASFEAAPVGQTHGDACPAGFRCPSGTAVPIDCQPGFYQDQDGQSTCKDCPERYYCPDSEMTTPTPCPIGSECPGDNRDAHLPCSAGFYQNYTARASCDPCPAGFRCSTEQTFACPAGFYCPPQTAVGAEVECPAGTFSSVEYLTAVGECTDCTAGNYCSTDGLTDVEGPCTAGYVCYSESQTPTPTDGVRGEQCPAGYYCPEGTPAPQPCPAGTFNPSLGGTSELAACQPCTEGFFCDEAAQTAVDAGDICDAGYYCPAGSSNAQEYPCPKGNHCPLGSARAQPCDPGEFQANEIQSTCTTCLEGRYCPDFNMTTPLICDAGGVCPLGSDSVTFCDPGTYNENPGMWIEATHCLPCPATRYCAAPGTDSALGTAICPAGYYCPEGTASGTTNGCVAGEYCPEGSDAPVTCPKGKFCNGPLLDEPSGDCTAGFFCDLGSTIPNGVSCSQGFYCPAGTTSEIDCPTGTYGAAPGLADEDECEPCTAGRFCGTPGLTATQGPCAAGYFCDGGESTPTPVGQNCTIGHQCPEGSEMPEVCPDGTWEPDFGSSACEVCPPSYYCVNGSRTPCIEGHYCPSGTEFPTEFECAPGSFMAIESNDNSTCTLCSPGKYCPNFGQTEATDDCPPGYVCRLGSATGMEEECPPGHYCVGGNDEEEPCPPGTYFAGTGLTNVTACTPCDAGEYCETEGLSAPTGDCDGGYLCYGGADTPTPIDGVTGEVCPIGHYCPPGATFKTACDPGTYQPTPAQPECEPCPAGSYCGQAAMFNATTCPSGSYCPEGSTGPQPCPAGRLTQADAGEGLTSPLNCTACYAGMYCDTPGAGEPSGFCGAGFVCQSAATQPNPPSDALGNGPCPKGYYCPGGNISTIAIPCNAGTYNNKTGADSEEDCLPCISGQYCATQGLALPTDNCAEGYYCPGGVESTEPRPGAYICPPGYFCPSGTPTPINCEDGYYQDLQGEAECKGCPAGAYCHSNATNAIPCPSYSYCPPLTAIPPRCPHGTYTFSTGLQNSTQCEECPPGKYCRDGNPVDDCEAGFICWGGESSPTPSESPCPRGHYCPAGTEQPIPCTGGLTRLEVGGTQVTDCGPCPGGYKCVTGDPVPKECERGEYCPYNRTLELCPQLSYGPVKLAENITDCAPCPAGHYCNITGLGAYENYECPLGNYCPEASHPVPCPAGTFRDTRGAVDVDDCTACPVGYYCPLGTQQALGCDGGFFCDAGSSEPTVCPAGYWCPQLSNVIQDCPAGSYCLERTASPQVCEGGTYCPPRSPFFTTCPAGFYCPYNTSVPIPCDAGVWCDSGSSEPRPCPQGRYCPAMEESRLCPNGTYSPVDTIDRRTVESACVTCPAGQHGSHPERAYCSDCDAGYVCLEGAHGPTPIDEVLENGYKCPEGHYCPIGSPVATPCPAGMYYPTVGADAITDCRLCPEGSYNDIPGASACRPCGASAHSLEGATLCACNGTARAFQPSDGSCRCQPGYEFYDDDLELSVEDSPIDCQPIVYDRCTGDSYRDPATGDCVDIDGTECAEQCGTETGGGTGRLVATSGICECVGVADEDDVCDVSCRNNQVQMYIDPVTGYLMTYDPLLGNTTSTDLMQFSADSSTSCGADKAPGECSLVPLVVTDDGMAGVYDPPATFIEDLVSVSRSRKLARRQGRKVATRKRQNVYESTIDQPVVCIREGDGLVWDVSEGVDNYPEYVKDSLFNSNPDFDYGAFLALASYKQSSSSGEDVTVFAFTFTTEGVYVFRNAAQPSRMTFVSVVGANEQCPSDAAIKPTTATNLVSVGVAKNDGLILKPDYLLIVTLLIVLFLLVLLVIYFFMMIRRKSWSAKDAKGVQYRRLGQAHDFNQYASKGSTVTKRMQFKKYGGVGDDDVEEAYRDNFWDYERQIDLEGFNVKTLYDKLEDQTIHVTSQLAEQKEHVRAFFDKISEQTELLGDMLSKKLDEGLTVGSGDKGGSGAAGDEDPQRNMTIDERLADDKRRKNIAAEFAEQLNEMQDGVYDEEAKREAYDKQIDALRGEIEALDVRIAAALKDAMNDPDDSELRDEVAGLLGQYGEALDGLAKMRETEAMRRGVGVGRADVVGCELIDPSTNKPVPIPHLMSSDTNRVKAVPGLTQTDEKTQLIVPVDGRQMRTPAGNVIPVPANSFMHPTTGLVVGLAEVGAAPSGLIMFCDEADEELVPYVPAPTGAGKNPDSWLACARNIETLPSLVLGSRISDPQSGAMSVPIIGATVDPSSGRTLPVAGTMKDAVTSKTVPIELGGSMLDAKTGQAVPISGVSIDAKGNLVPLGGTMIDPKTGKSVPIQGMGELGTDPLTGKIRQSTGSTIDPETGIVTVRTAGGLAAMDTTEINAEEDFDTTASDQQQTMAKYLIKLQELEDKHADDVAALGDDPTPAAEHAVMMGHQLALSTLRLDLEDALGTSKSDFNDKIDALQVARERNHKARAKRKIRLRQAERKLNQDTGSAAAADVQKTPAAVLALKDEEAQRDVYDKRQAQYRKDIATLEDQLQKVIDSADGAPTAEELRVMDELNKALDDKLAGMKSSAENERKRREKASLKLTKLAGKDVVDELAGGDADERRAEDAYIDAHRKSNQTVAKLVSGMREKDRAFKEEQAKEHDEDKREALEEKHERLLNKMEQDLEAEMAKIRNMLRAKDTELTMAKDEAKLNRNEAMDMVAPSGDGKDGKDGKNGGAATNEKILSLSEEILALLQGLMGGKIPPGALAGIAGAAGASGAAGAAGAGSGGAKVDSATSLLVPEPAPATPRPGRRAHDSALTRSGASDADFGADSDALLAEHEKELLRLAQQAEINKARQKQELADRIAARKARNAEKRAIGLDTNRDEALVIHELEAEELDNDLAAEAKIEEEALAARLAAEEKVAKAKREKELQDKLALATSDEDRAAILAAHEKSLRDADKRTESERARQQAELKAKLAERRKNRLKAQQAKQEAELKQVAVTEAMGGTDQALVNATDKELVKETQENEEDANKELDAIKRREKEALEAKFKAKLARASSEEERSRLQALHDAERAAVDEKFESEKARQKAAFKAKLEERRRKKKEAQKRAADAAAVPAGQVSKDALEAEAAAEAESELKQELLKAEAAEDKAADAERDRAEKDLNARLAAATSDADRERILAEHEARLRAIDDEAERRKARQQQQLKEKLAERKKKKLAAKEKAAAGGKVDEAAIKSEADREAEAEVKMETRAEEAKIEAKAAQDVSEEADKLAKELKKASSDEDKEKLLREHEAKMKKIEQEEALAKERQRQKMQEKLAEKKKKKLAEKRERETVKLGGPLAAASKEDLQALAARAAEQELEAEMRFEESRIDNQVLYEAAEASVELQNKLAAASNEEERARLLAEHEAAMRKLEDDAELAKARQRQAVKDRLANRKRTKLSDAKNATKESVAEDSMELRASREAEAELSHDVQLAEKHVDADKAVAVAETKSELADKLAAASNEDERKAIEAEYDARIRKIEADAELAKARQRQQMHEKLAERKARKLDEKKRAADAKAAAAASGKAVVDHSALERSAEREAELEVEQEQAKMEKRIEAVTAEQKAMAEEELEEKLANASEADKERLLKEHDAKMRKIAAEEELAKGRQQQKMREKLEKRKAAKLAEKEAASSKRGASPPPAAVDEDKVLDVLEKEHVKEAERLSEAIAETEKEQEADMEEAMLEQKQRVLREAKERQAKDLAARKAAGKLSAEEAARLDEEHRRELERLESVMEGEKVRQSRELKAKLAERREAKKRAQLAKQEAEKKKALVEARLHAEQLAAERALEAEQAALDEEIEKEVKAELKKAGVKEDPNDDAAKEEAEAVREKHRLEERRRDLEARTDLDPEERARLLAEHQAEISRLSRSLESDRARQREKIHEKIAAKKAKKAQELKRKREAEEARLAAAAAKAKAEVAVEVAETLGEGDKVKEKLAAVEHAQDEAARANEERHRKEQQDLEDEISREVEAELEKMGAGASDAKQAKKEADLMARKKRLERELAELNAEMGLEDDEKEMIMKMHQEAMKKLESQVDGDRLRQREKVHDKIAAKKAAKEAEMRERHAAEDQREEEKFSSEREKIAEQVTDGMEARLAAETGELAVAESAVIQETGPSAEELAIKMQHEKEEAALHERQAEEERKLEEQMEAEAKAKADQAAKAMEEQKEKLLKEKKEQMKQDLAARADLSDKEKKRLLEQHNRELSDLNTKLDSERARQQAALKEKMEAKRAKKKAMLQAKQESERARENAQREAEAERAAEKKRKEAEAAAIAEVKEKVSEEEQAAAIAVLLQQRHEKERVDLDLKHAADKATAVASQMKAFEDSQEAELAELKAKHEAEEADLKGRETTMSPADYEREEADMKSAHASAVQKMKDGHAAELRGKEDQIAEAIDVKNAEEKMALRKRHLDEINDQATAATPEQVYLRQHAADAERAMKEAEEFKARLAAEKAEQLDQMRKERQAFEAAKQKEFEEKLAAMNAELEADREREEKKSQERLREMERQRELLIQERKEKQAKAISDMGNMSEEQREGIMRAHQEELNNLEGALDKERERQKSKLQQKMAERRAKARQKKMKAAEKDMQSTLKQREEEEKRKLKEMNEKAAAEAKAAEQRAEEARAAQMGSQSAAPSRAATPTQAAPEQVAAASLLDAALQANQGVAQAAPAPGGYAAGGVVASPISPDQWLEMLTKSPLMKKLREIEDLLRSGELKTKGGDLSEETLAALKGAAASAPAGDAPKVREPTPEPVAAPVAAASGAPPSTGYQDAKDAQRPAEGRLVEKDVNELSAMNFVVYQFGKSVQDLLAEHNGHSPVTVLLAKSLPANNWTNNAFRNSYHYEEDTKSLFVRDSRAQGAGEFAMVLVHALAHIKVRSFDDDGNHAFLREFYKGMKVVCDELFFARGRDGASASSSAGKNALEDAFGRTRSIDDKTSVVQDVIDLRMSQDPDHFSKENLIARMEDYGGMAMNVQLKDYLTKLEDTLDDRVDKDLEERLADLEDKTSEARRSGAHAAESGDYIAALLEKQVDQAEREIDQLTAESYKHIKEVGQLKQQARAQVDKLTALNGELETMQEGTAQHRAQFQQVQDTTTSLRKAKALLRKANTMRENTASRLQQRTADLEKHQAALKAHRAKPAAERAALNREEMSKLKA